MPYITVAYTMEQEKIPLSIPLPFWKCFLFWWGWCIKLAYTRGLEGKIHHVYIKRITKQQAQQYAEQQDQC